MDPVVAEIVNVFTHDGQGGNPCPVVTDAGAMDGQAMQRVATQFGFESGFVLPSSTSDYDYVFRFWVPLHEMEMCGHATIGALWLLSRQGVLKGTEVRVQTRSGPVTGFLSSGSDGHPAIDITQPAGKVVDLSRHDEDRVLSTLGLSRHDLLDLPIQNAVTSRVKTLIPIRSVERLNALTSDMARTEACCVQVGSTGLYPYAVSDETAGLFEARQFPRSSGYPEDAATGIAAAALAFGLLRNGLVEASDTPIRILQGRAMGRLSEIRVRLGFAGGQAIGCLLGGSVTLGSDES